MKYMPEKSDNTKNSVKIPKTTQNRPTPRLAAEHLNIHRKFNRDLGWRHPSRVSTIKFQGIQVFAPVDPYRNQQRQEFRSAMSNPYVYRASRIQATFTAGQGYTTEIVPRKEEDVPTEQLDKWQSETKIMVPYWDKELTPEEIVDKVDKMAIDMDLATNVFNAYFLAIEQGRAVLALTPLETDDEGNFFMPESIRLIRTEFTERPVIDDDTGELVGVRIIGVRSPTRDNILPTNRMIYVMHGFNNELFSDYYGDSKVSRISDEANTLNVVLNEDYERAAEAAWYKPPIFSVPIPPQEIGNEDDVLNQFLIKANDAKGQSIAVTGPSSPEETGVTVLNTQLSADIAGLETIRTGLIKAIITAYGLPGFMLSEGDIGKLGGNANIEEVDSYLNTEIGPERIILENTLEKQFYDVILAILFRVGNAREIPVKIKFKFNKPKLLTLVTPDMLEVMAGLKQMGLIDESGLREILGVTELDKDTVSKGAQGGPTPGANLWRKDFKQPIQINLWPDELGKVHSTVSGWGNADQWIREHPGQEPPNEWPSEAKLLWIQMMNKRKEKEKTLWPSRSAI